LPRSPSGDCVHRTCKAQPGKTRHSARQRAGRPKSAKARSRGHWTASARGVFRRDIRLLLRLGGGLGDIEDARLLQCSQRGWRWQRGRSGGCVEALGQYVSRKQPDKLVPVKHASSIPAARAVAANSPSSRNAIRRPRGILDRALAKGESER